MLSKRQRKIATARPRRATVIVGKGKNAFHGGVKIDPISVMIKRPGQCMLF